jgi:hypothetical protein
MEIIEGNKLIAEFMGFNVLPVDSLSGKRYEVIDFEHGRIKVENLDVDCFYHTSWDWLMPVVEKIESLSVDTKWPDDQVYLKQYQSSKLGRYYARFCSITSSNTWYIADVGGDSKIESAWLCVVEFIKWHNQQTLENENRKD